MLLSWLRPLSHQYTLLRTRTAKPWGPGRLPLTILGVAVFLLGISLTYLSFHLLLRRPPFPDEWDWDWDDSTPYPFSGIRTNVTAIDRLYARQSSSLAQAVARYTLRNNRPPPPRFERWYRFARNHSCLIDEYEQIGRDFAPFWELARERPGFFKEGVERAAAKIKRVGNGMKTAKFSGGRFSFTDDQWTLYSDDTEWPHTFARFATMIPDTQILINGRDEPRVLFNTRLPSMLPKALQTSDPDPFEIQPKPTDEFFKSRQVGCFVPNRETGFTGLANDASAFMLYSSSTQFTTDLFPMLSMTKVAPCFSDIMVPSQFYYSDSRWGGRFSFPDNVKWEDKIPKLYWRGKTSGGWIHQTNYHSFPRFRLIALSRTHPSLLDVAFSEFHDGLCDSTCDADFIKAEYGVTGKPAPREEVYRYRYAFDVDGNSFSGRYWGLLRSGSLVFKSTVFTEYFNDWLRPYEHYIPVLPDLSDLAEKVEWAIAHDAEARRIQQAGKAFADIVLRDEQNDCYWALVLLEWARLMEGGG